MGLGGARDRDWSLKILKCCMDSKKRVMGNFWRWLMENVLERLFCSLAKGDHQPGCHCDGVHEQRDCTDELFQVINSLETNTHCELDVFKD